MRESLNSVFHIKVNDDIKSCLKLPFSIFWHTERIQVVSFHQLLCWTKMSSLMEQKCFASLASRYSTVFGSWSGATAIMWISHAWSLSILSAPCGTFLPMMKCYCCQRQTFSLYQSPSWQPSLLRKTWDNFKVRTFSTRSGEPNFFPIYCSTTSFPFHHESQSSTSPSSSVVGAIWWQLHLLGPRAITFKEIYNLFLESSLETRLKSLHIDTFPDPQNSLEGSAMY